MFGKNKDVEEIEFSWLEMKSCQGCSDEKNPECSECNMCERYISPNRYYTLREAEVSIDKQWTNAWVLEHNASIIAYFPSIAKATEAVIIIEASRLNYS